MAGVPAFSSDELGALQREAENHPLACTEAYRRTCLHEYYEVQRCTTFIQENGFKRVTLQFPDFLLCDSAWVVEQLAQRCPSAQLYILGDTSYGSCCVDEVSAQHADADCVIHFGPSCLTRTKRLPVLYVFGQEELSPEECAAAFREAFPDQEEHIIVFYDVVYTHCLERVQSLISQSHANVVVTSLCVPAGGSDCRSDTSGRHTERCSQMKQQPRAACVCLSAGGVTEKVGGAARLGGGAEEGVGQDEVRQGGGHDAVAEEQSASVHRFAGRQFALTRRVEECGIFYIGYEGPTLSNIMMRFSQCKVHSYNPLSKQCRREGAHTNRSLGRRYRAQHKLVQTGSLLRYYLVQQAKEARTVGILVGTLGAADYLGVIQRVKAVIKAAGKKCYTIAIGKINPAKMANFMEVDIFVLVACPENSLLDSQEFFKPVITPFELEVACVRERAWTGVILSDFHELMPGQKYHLPLEGQEEVEQEPEYSFISGKLLPPAVEQDLDGQHGKELVERKPQDMQVGVYSSAAHYLHSRSWKGLEQQLGETAVQLKAAEGRSGLAVQYDDEPKKH